MDTTNTITTASSPSLATRDSTDENNEEQQVMLSTIRRAPPSSIAVRLIPGAGRGVVALRDIPRDTIVFEEDPYIMIPMANRRRLAVCICCGEQVVDKDHLNSAIEASAAHDDGDVTDATNSSLASEAVADNVVSSGGVMCEGGCGECYCSLECKNMFHTPSHINTGSCAALRLCRPAMSRLNTVDYNHLRAIVAFGMKAKSEGVAGGYLLSEDPHKKKKKTTKIGVKHRDGSGSSDNDDDESTSSSSSSSITEDSDWEDLPNWKRNKLVAQRKEERKAVKEAALAAMGIAAGCGGGIQPVHIKGLQSALATSEGFDGSPRCLPVINVLDEKEPVEVTRRRERAQLKSAQNDARGGGNGKKGHSRRMAAPANEPLEVVCDAFVAAQIPEVNSDKGKKKKNLDDYYLTVDIQCPPKNATFATAIAPLVTNFSEFAEDQLDSFRDVYNAYCDLFPADDSVDDSCGGGDNEGPSPPSVVRVSTIHDIVDLTTLPVFSEYMFLKMSAAFQCNGFSIYNTSLRRTHDREVGIGKAVPFSLPSGHHSMKASRHHSSAAVSPSLVAADVEKEASTTGITPQVSPVAVPSSSRPSVIASVNDRCPTPVTRDLELLTGSYGYAGYFNHACAPNIRKTFGGPCGRTLQFVTTKDVHVGDQMCISYGDSANVGGVEYTGTNLRRWRLQKQYYFLCCCSVCERK